jgi:urea-proton symporter
VNSIRTSSCIYSFIYSLKGNLILDLDPFSVLFTAVTTAGSAELVSVSSLVTYDMYRSYVKPWTTGRELMRVSRFTIIGFGLGMGILSSFLMQLGASLQYIYLAMGILIGPAVVPIALTVSWKKTNKNAAIMGSILGLVAGICSWITVTWMLYGHISATTTGETTPLVIGNIVSISVGATVAVIGSLFKPQNFNFDLMKQKILVVNGRINDNQFKRDARFTYRYAIALSILS